MPITLTVNLEVSGAAATTAITTQIAATIRRVWNASFEENYTVSSTVTANYRTEDSSMDSHHSQIFVTVDDSASNVSPFPSLYYATMNYHTHSNINQTPAHEFGHMLGLDDRYDEGIMSRINDLRGKPRSTSVQPGWDGNLMATSSGVLQKKNLEELFALHCMELVTFIEDDADEAGRWLDRGVRRLYNLPF